MPEEMMNQEQTNVFEATPVNNNEEQEQTSEQQNYDYDAYDEDDSEVLIFGMKPKTLAKFVTGGIAAGVAGKALVDKTVAKYKAKKAEKEPKKVKTKRKFRGLQSPLRWEYDSVEVGGQTVATAQQPVADPEQNPKQETAAEANS